MKPFIWPQSCHRSCLNSAPDLVYRFGKIKITLSWFPCHGFAKSATLCLFISSWFIFNGPTWCMTPIQPLISNGLHCIIWPWSVSASDKVAALRLQIYFLKLQNKKSWSSFSITIRINKGGCCEFLAIAIQGIWQWNHSW